jgi:Fic family protein
MRRPNNAPRGLPYAPDPLLPAIDLDFDIINCLADAECALGELKGVGQRLPNPHLLISPFLRREAVLSSRMEGTTAGLQQLLVFESAPTTDPAQSDVREVANYVSALELGFSLLDKLPISLRLIREVHTQLMEGVRGHEQRPGEFRRIPNLIGHPGATPESACFVPPPAKAMHEALENLKQFVGERRSNLPFLIQLAPVHYQFEAIHPFMDGNGRLGRLLIALQLREREYLSQPLLYLSAYFERHNDAYRDHLLNVSRSGAWNEWIDFFLRGVADQAHHTAQRSYRLDSWAYSSNITRGHSRPADPETLPDWSSFCSRDQ